MLVKVVAALATTLGVGEIGVRQTYGKGSVEMFQDFCARHSRTTMSQAPGDMPCEGGRGGGPYNERGHGGGGGGPQPRMVEGQGAGGMGGRSGLEENFVAAGFMQGSGPVPAGEPQMGEHMGEHMMGEHMGEHMGGEHMGGEPMGERMRMGGPGMMGEGGHGSGPHGGPQRGGGPRMDEGAPGMRGAARGQPAP